jgi:hypothetical protein
MKTCQQCEKENPSSANCCMYCGAVLSEENLGETARLQRDINAANETITLLKQSLLAAQEQIKNQNNETNNAKIQSLQTQLNTEKKRFEKLLIEKDHQYSIINTELATAKTQKKSSSWGWVFVVLFILSVIIILNNETEKEKINVSLNKLSSENEQSKNALSSYSNSNQEKIAFLEERINTQNEEIDTLRKQLPQSYRVIVSEAYCYVLTGGVFKNENSYYSSGAYIDVYTFREDYALTQGGWLKTADLEKN